MLVGFLPLSIAYLASSDLGLIPVICRPWPSALPDLRFLSLIFGLESSDRRRLR